MRDIFINLLITIGLLGIILGSVLTHFIMLLCGYKKER